MPNELAMMDMVNPVYHAVYVPTDDYQDGSDNLHVYTDKLEALKIIKQYKKGRLKSFKTREDADDFALNGMELPATAQTCNNNNPPIDEKTSNFKAPKPQNLTQFRKVIERGDVEQVRTTIWSNPRYLVSCGDTPSILHEGCRYNAMHVAVKSPKFAQAVQMCELILNTVGDPKFVELIYGEEGCKSYVDRASILRDLYLNTPDKGLNETPLHFAAKFGLKEVVRTLISYPQCNKNPLNKYQQTPADIACTRKNINDKPLIAEIQALLMGEVYYVPVLRSQDHSLQPRIGEPFSPHNPPVLKTDPLSSPIDITAVAGPMTKSQALEFKKIWKTPPRLPVTPCKLTSNSSTPCGKRDQSFGDLSFTYGMNSPANTFRYQDAERGLERDGRELASECKVEWKERWPFSNDFINLRSREGLDKLENHLGSKMSELGGAEGTANLQMIKANNKLNRQLDSVCKKLENLIINGFKIENEKTEVEEEEDNFEFVTSPSSPGNDFYDAAEEFEDNNINFNVFIEGTKPTKIDFAVMNAIPSYIDVNSYPCIYRWRHEMQLAQRQKESQSKNKQRSHDDNKVTKRKLFN